MAAVDYQSIPPEDLIKEANQALTDTGNAVTQGANIAPDYVMRLMIAARDILDRHEPGELRPGQYQQCRWCSATWPCPDVTALFEVLAVGEGES